MGLMFSRRRAEAKKGHDAHKAKAHADNHQRAKEAHEAGVHPAEIQNPKAAKPVASKQVDKVAANGADKPGAK